jgi:cytochrome c biogenesis protein CcmG, thiol:disulfide interchange protein DsbE
MSSRPTPDRSSGSNRGMLLTLGGVALVVAGMFVVALLVSGDDEAAGLAQTAPVAVEGQALPDHPGVGVVPDPIADPATGLTAPTVRGVAFDGTPVEVAGDGTPRLLLFLAHWCPHCQREVPKIQELVDAGGVPDGVEVVAVATSTSASQPNYPPSSWLAGEGWSSSILVDDDQSSTSRAYGVTAFPYGVYLDGDGRVMARTAGAVEMPVVEQLLAELARS